MDREKLEKTIRDKVRDGKMPCAMCFRMAEEFGITNREMGEVLNQLNIKISQCQLGCF